jgi:hypothetical protein
MRRLFGILTVAVVLLSACDPVGPVDELQRQDLLTETPLISGLLGRSENELTFARYVQGMGPEVLEASFTAVKGRTSTLQVRYEGQDESEAPLLEFRVGPNSLLLHPDGSLVLPGQAVTITVTLDPVLLYFHFEPHGLTFSPLDPARLRLNYAHADDDVNGDGIINFLDAVLQLQFRIWRQDALGLPFVQIPTIRQEGDVLEGRVTHFTGFALAS